MDAVTTIRKEKHSTVLASIVGSTPTPTSTPTAGGNVFPFSTVRTAQSPPSSGMHSSSEKGVLLIHDEDDFYSIQKGIHTIIAEANVCNEGSIDKWSFNSYPQLRALSVGSQSFRCVGNVRLEGLLKLESVEIGEGSFTLCGSTPNTCTNNAFIISNCPKLKSISIGAKSFIDWGEFQLLSRSAMRE